MACPAFQSYVKKHIEHFAGCEIQPANYPYPESFLEHADDVFEVYLLDGGAFACVNEWLGQASGKHVLQQLADGMLFKPWQLRDEKTIQWNMLYDVSYASKCNPYLEKHVWLNRLYFLLALAWDYHHTGNEQQAQLWWQYLSDWQRSQPYNEHALKYRKCANYVWYDMQVAWRTLVIIHSLHLLKGSQILTQQNCQQVYKLLQVHGQHVLAEVTRELNDGTGHGNHFLQKGLVLLYAGILFPELFDRDMFVAKGQTVIAQQMRNEILEDGGSIEASPSYSHFIARMYVEAYLLHQENNLPIMPGLKETIDRQYSYLAQTMTPEGKTQCCGDSYAMDAHADIKRVLSIVDLPPAPCRQSVCFKPSRTTVLHTDSWSVYVAGNTTSLAHHHPGNPSLVCFFRDIPFIWEAGICNYDRDVRDYHQSVIAHNSMNIRLLANESPVFTTQHNSDPVFGMPTDTLAQDFKTYRHNPPQIDIVDFQQNDGKVEVTYICRQLIQDCASVWTRQVSLANDQLDIRDSVESDRLMQVCQIFHLGQFNVCLSEDQTKLEILLDQQCLQADSLDGRCFELGYHPLMNSQNRYYLSPTIVKRQQDKSIKFWTRFKMGTTSFVGNGNEARATSLHSKSSH